VLQLLFKEDSTVDDLIDMIEGNRRYVKCLYVYNKVCVCDSLRVCFSSSSACLVAAGMDSPGCHVLPCQLMAVTRHGLVALEASGKEPPHAVKDEWHVPPIQSAC
jgi:ribosome-interacting GTPase 1